MTARLPSDDDPVTLKEACEIVFRNTIGPGTLLTAAARGQITISRIGRRNFTTLREARSLLASCRVESNHLAFTSTKAAGNGLSETDHVSSAQAALKATLSRLKSNSRHT